jgi:fido (protein-threonine AMPylation protein)
MKKTRENSPHKLLAAVLSKAVAASRNGILKTSLLERGVRERLSAAGCLTEIIKGWQMLTPPGATGGSTAWFGGFWSFVGYYLSDRFGKKGYCLSAESSVDIHSGESVIGRQLSILTKRSSNQVITLPHHTSLYLYADTKNFPAKMESQKNINVMPLAQALCRIPPAYYRNKPLNIEIALRMLPSASEISRCLLDDHADAAASRIVGAYRAMGDSVKADHVLGDMAAAGFNVKTVDPFSAYEPVIGEKSRLKSPYAGRIQAWWSLMRESVLKQFPREPGPSKKPDKTLKTISELYLQDAYHSLSIEGYQVTQSLIDKIASGDWDPDASDTDQKQVNAMAAKGYHEAFNAVLASVGSVLKQGRPAGAVFEEDLQVWYRQLFSPSVQAGVLKASDLAGYRNAQVYIRNSRHIPLPPSAIADAMEVLFELLMKEDHAAVRAVLGHFFFVYIHPYMDGNGRIGRFLMNLMLVSGGYPWTLVRVEHRKKYMDALEQASVHGEISAFAKLICSEMNS